MCIRDRLGSIVVGPLGAIESATAVDQDRITGRWDDGKVGANSVLDNAEVRNVIPVTQHHRTDVDVVIHRSRTVNDKRTGDTSSELGAVVGVVPAAAVYFCQEVVREAVAWSDWALTNGWYTVLPRCQPLELTVPVERRALLGFGDVVVNGNFDAVAPVGFDHWPRELIVDQDHVAKNAIC